MNINTRRSRGFTLIELLVVVLILGILLAIAIPAYLSSIKTSRGNTAMTNAHAIATAVQSSYVQGGGLTYVGLADATGIAAAVTQDLGGGAFPTNPCTGSNVIAADASKDWMVVTTGTTKYVITPTDPNGHCVGLAATQLGQ